MTKAQQRFKRLLIAIPLIAGRGEEGVPIDELVKKAGYSGVGELADDMDFLDRFILPGSAHNTYMATVQQHRRIRFKFPAGRSMGRFPLTVTAGELLTLSVAIERLVGEGVLAADARPVRLVRRLLKLAEKRGRGARRFLAVDAGHKELGERLRICREAKGRKRSLEMVYYTPTRGDLTRRRLDVYAIYFNGDEWYVIGHCHRGREIRTFRLDRMREVRLGRESYSVPASFKLEEHLARGLYRPGEKDGSARLRFAGEAAVFAREEFRPSQLKRAPGGGVDVSVRTSNPSWVVNRALCYADACRLLGPPALRRELVDKAKRTLSIYEKR